MAYYENYLIDTTSRVILGVEATPALFHQEAMAARKMLKGVEKFGIQPESLGADKGYDSGKFFAWLLERGVQPHIPVIDRRHQTGGRFTRDQFRYDPAENVYYCPEGKALRYRGRQFANQAYTYRSTEAQCQGCPQKKLCTPGAYRKISVNWYQPARQAVRALVGTPQGDESVVGDGHAMGVAAQILEHILGPPKCLAIMRGPGQSKVQECWPATGVVVGCLDTSGHQGADTACGFPGFGLPFRLFLACAFYSGVSRQRVRSSLPSATVRKRTGGSWRTPRRDPGRRVLPPTTPRPADWLSSSRTSHSFAPFDLRETALRRWAPVSLRDGFG